MHVMYVVFGAMTLVFGGLGYLTGFIRGFFVNELWDETRGVGKAKSNERPLTEAEVKKYGKIARNPLVFAGLGTLVFWGWLWHNHWQGMLWAAFAVTGLVTVPIGVIWLGDVVGFWDMPTMWCPDGNFICM